MRAPVAAMAASPSRRSQASARPQLQGSGLLAEVAGGPRQAEPPVGMLDAVRQLVGHPRGLGGDGGQLEVVVLLGQAQLGEAQRLVGGTQLEVAARALAGDVDQLVEPAGPVQVPGDGGEVVAVAIGQRLDRPLVDAPPLPSEQTGLDRLLGERVAEGEDVGLVLDHDPLVDKGAQGLDQLVLGDVAHRRENIERDAPSEHRGRLDDSPLDGFEPVELSGDHLGDAPRQRLVGEVLEPALTGGTDELFEEEGVAAAAQVQALRRALVGPLPVHRVDERGDLVDRELLQPEVEEALSAVEAGQQLAGGVPPGHGVGTERPDHEQRRSDRVGQSLEQRDALRVGPVEVLEHDEPEALPDEPVHELEPGVDPFVAAPGSVGDRGEQLGVETVVAFERIDEQLHRTPERTLVGLPGEHDGPARRPLHQLAHEARLAHAGLAGHHDGRRARQPVEERQQAVEVDRPSDHRGREAAASDEHSDERIGARASS